MFDNEIKAGLKKGDPDAYREVFRLLYPRLRGYCKLFVSNQSEVEDIIQECFLNLWEKRKNIDPKKRIESLLFVMVRNRCLNFLKNQKFNSEKITIENLDVRELQGLYQLDLNEKEERYVEEMLVISFKKAIDRLPNKMRTVFVKCKLEGKKQKEVAEELGVSVKMVEKHIAKAKRILKEQLIEKYPALIIIILMMLN